MMPGTRDGGGGEEPVTARAQLRQWLAGELADVDEVHIPTLRDKALAHFAGDGEFLRQLAAEALPTMVAEGARSVIGYRRGQVALVVGDEVLTKNALVERATASRFERWFEHAGTRHIKLTKMTKTQLEEAADERERVAGEHWRRAEFLRELAKRLEGTQTVEDVYDDEAIEQLLKEVTGGDF
jgi:hypothetical protein